MLFANQSSGDGETAMDRSMFRVRQFASKCCGAPDKIRCGFGDTMCKVNTDFKPKAAALANSCGQWSDDVFAYSKRSWNDADFCSFLDTFRKGPPSQYNPPGHLKQDLKQYGACCGGLAKVRCMTDDASSGPANASSGAANASSGQGVLPSGSTLSSSAWALIFTAHVLVVGLLG